MNTSETNLDLCAVNKRTGYCQRCGLAPPVDQETGERSCSELSSELSAYDDDGDYDPDAAGLAESFRASEYELDDRYE